VLPLHSLRGGRPTRPDTTLPYKVASSGQYRVLRITVLVQSTTVLIVRLRLLFVWRDVSSLVIYAHLCLSSSVLYDADASECDLALRCTISFGIPVPAAPFGRILFPVRPLFVDNLPHSEPSYLFRGPSRCGPSTRSSTTSKSQV
jgi:hypothetical protein